MPYKPKIFKNLDRNASENSVDPDQTALEEQSDQGLHYFGFCWQFFYILQSWKILKFSVILHENMSAYFVSLHKKQSDVSLVLQHEALIIANQ